MTKPRFPRGYHLDEYVIEQDLATGTFGELYRARSGSTLETVVLKVLAVPAPLRVREDLFAVGERLLSLSHVHLVPTLALHLDKEPLYVVTVHVAGGSLRELLRERNRPMNFLDAMKVMGHIGQGVAYLHQQQVVHRGIQPASILLNYGVAQLGGFDLALPFDQLHRRSVLGTARYRAPEQDQGIASEKTDQYALGCVAFELFTGTVPDPEASRAQLVSCLRAIPARTTQAVQKALEPLPQDRHASVMTFLRALQESV